MAPRTDLQTLFETIAEHVYFQPPSNLGLQYPCIVYELDNMRPKFADNQPYLLNPRYLVTVIDRNPDSEIPKAVASLPLCTFDRTLVMKNLNHYVFTIYF